VRYPAIRKWSRDQSCEPHRHSLPQEITTTQAFQLASSLHIDSFWVWPLGILDSDGEMRETGGMRAQAGLAFKPGPAETAARIVPYLQRVIAFFQ